MLWLHTHRKVYLRHPLSQPVAATVISTTPCYRDTAYSVQYNCTTKNKITCLSPPLPLNQSQSPSLSLNQSQSPSLSLNQSHFPISFPQPIITPHLLTVDRRHTLNGRAKNKSAKKGTAKHRSPTIPQSSTCAPPPPPLARRKSKPVSQRRQQRTMIHRQHT